MHKKLLECLQELETLKHIPPAELKWLADHSVLESYPPGVIATKGSQIEYLWIILQGEISVRIDRGAGPKKVNTDLGTGMVTGMLPYSRLVKLPGDTYAEEPTEVCAINQKDFSEMIIHCPQFTAHTVHVMIDRTRIHNSSAMQDEKMLAMGRMAAGLAHELNNPASVAIRDAKLLREGQDAVDLAARQLSRAGLDEAQFEQLAEMRKRCMEYYLGSTLSAIEKSDLQDQLSDWLEAKNIDNSLSAPLADLAVKPDNLQKLVATLPGQVAENALQWIVTRCNLDRLAGEIERTTNQICQLVDAVKKFTHMDNLAQKELVSINAGINETLKLLDSKSKTKQARLILEIDNNLPEVHANGAELNQVWFSLLDNALDAIPPMGMVRIKAALETDLIAVRITDNGPGIPADMMERVFDPFFTTKPPGQGTGLGLDISRRLVRGYNGDITVKSKEGKTEFCVNLQVDKKKQI